MKRLFWDIETSPNVMFSWRSGYKINLEPHMIINERQVICICWKWEGQKKVYSLSWDDGDDVSLIRSFAPVLELADEAVAHNGDNFDIRWYNARHFMHDLPPIPMTRTVDTLKIAKRRFYLNSYRLDYIAQKILGRGKIHTNFDLWRDCIELTQPNKEIRDRSVRKMVRYCKRDVAILEQVWKRMSAYETPSTHAAVVETGDPKDRWRCAHCGSENVATNKRRVTAKGMTAWSMKCGDCGRYYQIANAVYEWYRMWRRGTLRCG